ncbi:MAG TPA: hypothetical protein DCE43_17745, partial [Planctomycetaceae bacterium]|nr:hypothetical protein [Planctomycetaceae bacterium]
GGSGGRPGAEGNAGGQPSPEALVERLDRNKNGKLERDELPGRMGQMLERGDT